MLTRFFARRYLFSPKSRSVINVIAGVSVLSFAMPVAAMIVLLSVLNGFGDFAKSMSSAFDADLTVAPREGQTFASAEIDSLALTRVKGVGVVSYLLEQQVLLERDGLQTMATLRGVDDRYTEVFPIEETIPLGSWSVRTGDLDRLVLGRDMARTLGIRSLVRAKSPSMPCGAAVSRRCFPSMDIRCGGSTSEDSSFSIWKARMNTHLPPCVQPRNFSIVRDAYRRSRCA